MDRRRERKWRARTRRASDPIAACEHEAYADVRQSRGRPSCGGQPHGGWLAYHPKGYAVTIAPTLNRYLAAENIQYAEILHVFTMSSARTAQACHVSGDRFAKAVVLRHDGGYMLAVVPASHHVNLQDLKERLGADLVMANESEVNRLFADCAHGAVPAVGRCYGLDLIV